MGKIVQNGEFTFEKPDFSFIEYNTPQIILSYLGGMGPKGKVYKGLITNYLKQSDFFHLQFSSACDSIEDYFNHESTNLLSLIWSHCFFENSITSLHLATKFLLQIKKDKNIPLELRRQIPRNLNVLQKNSLYKIRKSRDILLHMYGDILNKHSDDYKQYLEINSDCVNIGSYKFEYSELFSWLAELSNIGKIINTFFYGTWIRSDDGAWNKLK